MPLASRLFRRLGVASVLLFAVGHTAGAQAFDGDADTKCYGGYLNAGGISGGVVGMDKGVNSWLSIGCAVSCLAKDSGDKGDGGVSGRLDLLFSGNCHWQDIFGLPMPLDLYTGVHLGYRTAGLQSGVRYNLGETVGVYAEARQNLVNVAKSSDAPDCYYYRKFCFSVGLTFNF